MSVETLSYDGKEKITFPDGPRVYGNTCEDRLGPPGYSPSHNGISEFANAYRTHRVSAQKPD